MWRDNRDGNYEVYYKRITDGGHSWSDEQKLTRNQGNSFWPTIAVSDNLVHLLWCDERNGVQGLYYIFSSDSGETWSEETRLTNCILPLGADVMGAHPFLVVEPYIHVVFNHDQTGENEIYYKRGVIISP